MNLLEVFNISKSYTLPDGSSLKVLDDISFIVENGQFISILGPSGSGKTSLLQLIGLMDSVSSGEIFIEQQLVSTLTKDKKASIRAKKIGFVFQTPMLITDLTVEQNINIAKKVVKAESNLFSIDELLSKIGLLGKKTCFPSTLSSGEAQRVSIVRSMINNPSIILADEPISHLDKSNKIIIMDLLKSISEESKTCVILASHDDIVMNYSHVVYKLEDGKLKSENMPHSNCK